MRGLGMCVGVAGACVLQLSVCTHVWRSCATVHASAGQDAGNGGHHAGKLVGNPTQIRLDELLQEDEALCCPVRGDGLSEDFSS